MQRSDRNIALIEDAQIRPTRALNVSDVVLSDPIIGPPARIYTLLKSVDYFMFALPAGKNSQDLSRLPVGKIDINQDVLRPALFQKRAHRLDAPNLCGFPENMLAIVVILAEGNGRYTQ